MPRRHASIFNDVIGPVMRGPSSSHTAASWRIAKLARQFFNAPLNSALIEFDRNGAWAPNFREQGTTLGMDGGLLGIDIEDDRMKYLVDEAERQQLKIDYQISHFNTYHPNTVRLTITDKEGENHRFVGISLGGGAFGIVSFDGFKVNLTGDRYVLILITDSLSAVQDLKAIYPDISVSQNEEQTRYLAQLSGTKPFSQSEIDEIKKGDLVLQYYLINPVMPVVINEEPDLPFQSVEQMIAYATQKDLNMGDCGLIYETGLTGVNRESLSQKMDHLISIMEQSIETGKRGTEWKDRILHRQSHLIQEGVKKGRIIPDTLINEIITNVTAIMEAKSAMEVVVANPTAGSCGTVAGVVQAVAGNRRVSREELIRAYFAAGMVGVFFAEGPGFAAEEHGCQVECGASAGMAAAAIVQLCGGNTADCLNAASLAIQNMIGLICDPIADRVEAPCLGKNVSAAVNAYASATMVLAGYHALIPYDQVLETVSRVGNHMPACHKCTGEGGLAITPAAKLLKKQLENVKPD